MPVFLRLVLLSTNVVLTAAAVFETSAGVLKSDDHAGLDGRTYFTMLGVPYAQPPIGHLRFEKPRSYSWEGMVKSRQRPKCVQLPYDATTMSEDCLHLNIYGQLLEQAQQLPVLVFLGFDSYNEGSTRIINDSSVHALYTRCGVLVVTLNYRLGPLGFWSTGTMEAPGNYGLWDQQAALSWVRNEIGVFGGDPLKITLMGWSAGGTSAMLLNLSPYANGLFQQWALLSGQLKMKKAFRDATHDNNYLSLYCGCSLPSQKTSSTRSVQPWSNSHFWQLVWNKIEPQLANLLGKSIAEDTAPAEQSDDMPHRAVGIGWKHPEKTSVQVQMVKGCMKNLPVARIVDGDAQDGFFPGAYEKLVAAAPAKNLIIGTTESESATEAFLSVHEGLPLVANEGLMRLAVLRELQQELGNSNAAVAAAMVFKYVSVPSASDSEGGDSGAMWFDQYVRMRSALDYWIPAAEVARKNVARSTQRSTFLFSFDNVDRNARFPIAGWKGVPHDSFLKYLFDLEPSEVDSRKVAHYRGRLDEPFSAQSLSRLDRPLQEVLTDMISNFAIFGQPASPNVTYEERNGMQWDPVNSRDLNYLSLTLPTPQMRLRYHASDVDFWTKLVADLRNELCF